MKILLLIPTLSSGGSERVMTTLANKWAIDNTVDIMLFHNYDPFYHLNPNVNLIKMGFSIPSSGVRRMLLIPIIEIKRYLRFSKQVRLDNYDFILSFTNIANIFASFYSFQHPNANVFISERADPLRYNRLMRYVSKCLFYRSSGIICQSIAVKNYFESNKATELLVLPNPVCFTDIPPIYDGERRHVIVSIGRLAPQKNHRLLIEAFVNVLEEFPDYSLEIYGEGPLKDELAQLIINYNLSDKVFLMGTKKKVMSYVRDAKLFVLSSDYEGFPNVLIEAMATGLPVISSNFSTGIANEIIGPENGMIFEVGNVSDLTKCMKAMLSKDSNELHLIGNSNVLVAQQFDEYKVADKWLTSIKRIIDS